MRDRAIDETAKCPFYITVTEGHGYAGVLCEPIMDDKRLGFRVVNHMRLESKKELRDFVDIFCCDAWETCPYAKAMIAVKYNGEK